MRKRYKIPLFTLGILLLLAVGVSWWLVRSDWLRNQIIAYVNRTIAPVTDLRVTAGDLGGDFYSRLVIRDLVITTPSADTVASIVQVTIDYSLRDLFPDRRRVRGIVLDRPILILPRDTLSVRGQAFRLRKGTSGRSAGAFDLSLENLFVRDGVVWREGDSLPLADSIQLSARLEARQGEVRLAVLPSWVRIPRLGMVQAEGRAQISDTDWRCDSVLVRTVGSRVLVSGSPAEWVISADPIDLGELRRVAPVPFNGRLELDAVAKVSWQEKHVSATGTVTGTLAGYPLRSVRLAIDARPGEAVFDSVAGEVAAAMWHGSGRVDWSVSPVRWSYRGDVTGFNLEHAVHNTFPTDLSGAVDLNGVGSGAKDLRVRGHLDLGRGHINGTRFERAEGTIGANADSLLLAEDFLLQVNGTEMEGGGTIAFADSIDLFANVHCPNVRVWDDAVFVDSLAGRADGYMYLSGLTEDPDLSGGIVSDSLRLFDLTTRDFEARVFVPRFLSEPSGRFTARFGRSSTWGVPTDSLDVAAHMMGHDVVLDWARWFSPQVALEGAAVLNWSGDTIPISIYPLTVRWEGTTYSADDSVRLWIDSAGADFAPFAFEGPLGIARASGRLGFDESLNLRVGVERLRLETVWGRFFPSVPLTGDLEADGDITGTFLSPCFHLRGNVGDLSYRDNSYGDVTAVVSYADRVLRVDSLLLTNDDFSVAATGSLPIDLAFHPVARRVLDGPLSGTLTANGNSLDRFVPFWPETLESIRGDFALQAVLSGTPQHPRFTGTAAMVNGTIKALEIVNPLENVAVDLDLCQDTIRVTRASAVVRDGDTKGTVTGGGQLRILSPTRYDYALRVTGTRVPARFEFEDYFVITDLDITVTGETPPLVAGSLHPLSVEDREPMATEEELPQPDTTLWDWDITVDAPGNYWIRNDQIEAELSADLRLVRQRGQINYLGTAELIRGKVYLFDKVGQIKSGTLTFDDPSGPDPRLDIEVTFRIQQPRLQSDQAGSSAQVIDLNVGVGGRASEPLIEPEAPYTEQDVLLLLTANTTIGADSNATVDPLASRLRFAATGLLFSEVQRVAARKLGLQTLEISPGADVSGTEITVGRYFSPHLYLYGTSPVTATRGQEVGFEYRFSRRLFLEGGRDEDNDYRLNLHFNWDY